MANTIKGPAIFLAQFLGDEAPFNSLESITKWAGDLGYKGVQIPVWDPRVFDLEKLPHRKHIATKSRAFAPTMRFRSQSWRHT